jgi:hypothetical protein
MLQAGKSLVRLPIRSLDFFFNLLNPSNRIVASGFAQPLSKMNKSCWDKERPARKADSIAFCELFIYKLWEPGSHTTLYASTARYRTFLLSLLYIGVFISLVFYK